MNESTQAHSHGAVKVAKGISKVLEQIDKVVLVVTCGLAASVALTVITSVFFRFVVNSSLLWGEELTRYLSIWLICLGLSSALRRNEHVSLSSLLEKFPFISKSFALRVADFLAAIISSAVAYFGWIATINNFGRGQLTPALQIEIAWIYLAIPVGFGLMAINHIYNLFFGRSDQK